jgi:hypothetical protein
MALQHLIHERRSITPSDLVRAFLTVMGVIVLLIALNAVFGSHGLIPTYQITSDPAWPLPF